MIKRKEQQLWTAGRAESEAPLSFRKLPKEPFQFGKHIPEKWKDNTQPLYHLRSKRVDDGVSNRYVCGLGLNNIQLLGIKQKNTEDEKVKQAIKDDPTKFVEPAQGGQLQNAFNGFGAQADKQNHQEKNQYKGKYGKTIAAQVKVLLSK